MTKLLLTTAFIIVAGLVVGRADAAPLSRAVDSLAAIKSYSAIHQAGCKFGTSRCPAGTKWSCTTYSGSAGKSKKCVCRTC